MTTRDGCGPSSAVSPVLRNSHPEPGRRYELAGHLYFAALGVIKLGVEAEARMKTALTVQGALLVALGVGSAPLPSSRRHGWRWRCRTTPRSRSPRTTRIPTRGTPLAPSTSWREEARRPAFFRETNLNGPASTSSTNRRRLPRPTWISMVAAAGPGCSRSSVRAQLRHRPYQLPFRPRLREERRVLHAAHGRRDPATSAEPAPKPGVVAGLDLTGYTTTPAIPTPTVDRRSSAKWCRRVEGPESGERDVRGGQARELLRLQHPLGEMTFNPAARPGDAEWRVVSSIATPARASSATAAASTRSGSIRWSVRSSRASAPATPTAPPATATCSRGRKGAHDHLDHRGAKRQAAAGPDRCPWDNGSSDGDIYAVIKRGLPPK